MPPRLSHHKSRLGCNRCKIRKVKCDEAKPRCGACERHAVPCEYSPSSVTPSENPHSKRSPSSGIYNGSHHSNAGSRGRDELLEMQLMHEWTAYVCESLCTTWRFWRYQGPTVAFKFRYLLDAMLALSALHASRQKPRRWVTLEGRMESIDDGRINSMPVPASATIAENSWVGIEGEPAPFHPPPEADRDLNVFDHVHMLHVSRVYFNRALEGQRNALARLTADNARATFMCSILVSYYALFTLSEDTPNPDLPAHDPIQWFRLAHGTVLIVTSWMEFAREEWVVEAGAMHGLPDLTDEKELFAPKHRDIFAYLLGPISLDSTSPASDDDITPNDREGYEQALSYLGVMYKNLQNGSDLPLATVRRVASLPSRLWGQYPRLVIEEQQPRALAILAHVFAVMKFVDGKVPWCKGIAERQVPFLCNLLPGPYRPLVAWPLRVVQGDAGPPGL